MKKLNKLNRAETWWMQYPSDFEVSEKNKDQGLSSSQANERLVQFGSNRISDSHKVKAWKKYLLHFKNPLVLILIAASILSAVVGELANFIIILCIVFISVTLDFVQEYRANSAAEKLKHSMALRSSVMRDGQSHSILSTDIVPGDLVQLKAGDLVPADGFVIQARDCFVNQSSLTGESYPVEKKADIPVEIGNDIQEATHAVFMGSSVLSGSASVCIVKTGSATIMGQIAESMTAPEAPTSFEVGARHFNMMIMRLTMWMVLFVLMVNLLSHKNWLDSFLFAIALAVGLTPELLPMVVSVTLARGALRMAKQGVIVKRQSSIQDLGSMDVLCTDKTGTLTESKIRMESHVDALGVESAEVLRLAYLNSWFETGLRNPMDEAILKNTPLDVSEWKKIDEIPFDFERRRVSVLVENSGVRTLVVKGAPDEILRFCTHLASGDSAQPLLLDEVAELQARKVCGAFEDQGFRVLGIAYRRVSPDHSHALIDDESELVLAGFCAFLDPPKKEAGDTLPMMPAQILLNNMLYDLSEIAIPFDTVELNEMNAPAVLDMKLVQDFMWSIGPVSSLFDFITFGALLVFFDADQSLFQTGWFIESLCTQVLVIFVIRTRINPLKTRPHPWLIVTAVAVLVAAIGLPYTMIGSYFGFTPLPAAFFVMLTVMVVLYLLAVEFVKRQFFRRHSINNQPQYLI